MLLVEDNLVNQQIALGFLRHLGQEVVVASDGLEALTKVSEGRFVVLMDMQMPNMDGIDATRKIREMGGVFASVPIVAMTANASDEDRILCANAGMSDFQSKPITLAKLARILARSDHAVTCACPSVNDVGMAISNTRHQEIAEVLGQETLDELLETFFSDAAAILSSLSATMRQDDPKDLDSMLHALKGAASNVGFQEIANMAQALRHKLIITNSELLDLMRAVDEERRSLAA